MYAERDGDADQYHNSSSVGAATYRRGFPGVDVHCIWIDCAFLESIREEQLPECEMGPLSHEGRGNIPDKGTL